MPPLFPTSVVGSMPRSQFVRDLLAPERRSALSDEEFHRQLDAAVAYIIAVQEATGIDIISDGEWRRLSYIGVIAEIMDGFERTVQDGRYWHTVVAPMTLAAPGLIAEEARFLRAHTTRMTKVALPSPYLLGQRMWDPERSRKAYPTRQAFMEALVPVLRQELLAVRSAGVTVIQLDDPHLCLFVDERVRQQYDDPDHEADYCVGLLNDIIEGVEGVTLAIHLCRRNRGREGWVGEGGYGPIIPQLRRLKVHQYVMEFTIPAAGDLAVLRELPGDTTVGLGCVDCRSEHIDTPEEVAGRVERALQYLPPERVALNPDCGFAPGNAADIPIDEAYAKLRNEALAAEMLREKYA
ncbi:MAG: cobalamin-independent methionine synthase II family protein [Candidatus Latescibacteria bacterium]|nr:cobalamin-independent methionine synthase II family protein [Candidatus Latescibacterota bacterium]